MNLTKITRFNGNSLLFKKVVQNLKSKRMKDLKHILTDIQDYLVPKLDTYEQAIYHYIFRHTYLISKGSTIFSTRSAEIGYRSGTKNTPPSDSQRSKKLRSLEAKGAIKIIERSHKGILVSYNAGVSIQLCKSKN